MRIFSVIFLLFCAFLLHAEHLFSGAWKADVRGMERPVPLRNGEAELAADFPGGVLLYQERSRYSFKPDRHAFNSKTLSVSVKAEGCAHPLKAWIFVKDKDGAWFQSDREFSLKPGVWTRLSIRIDRPGRELFPKGHSAAWSGYFASRIFAAGVSIYGEGKDSARISMTPPVFEGERANPAPSVVRWDFPEKGKQFQTVVSRFRLNKEYFNPFDPDEIAADFEVLAPGAEKPISYPAFFSMDTLRRRHFTMETTELSGSPFWEFRFYPRKTGEYKIRLRLTESGGKEAVYTSWRTIHIEKSGETGAVRVSKTDSRFFELENGAFYYPVGLNIHTNTDQRGERVVRLKDIADCGNADYEMYIAECSKNGIDLIEVWMAAWTYAIEWSSSRNGYYGLGHYNLAAASRLDALLDFARKHKVRVNLVFDNHGKMTDGSDPEWNDSPFNAKGLFAGANNAFLDAPQHFWHNPRAQKFNRKRNRYIAARWGADPAVFAMELWSEVDLVAKAYAHRISLIAWHKKTALELRRNMQTPGLVATHICGEVGNLFKWRDLAIDPPELTHVCCDAYRKPWIPVVNQLEKHGQRIMPLKKPVLITEYGGTNMAGGRSQLKADIHGGLWASLFTRHAGTPMLWWHDFVHVNNEYFHYRAFRRFLDGIDLRSSPPRCGQIKVTVKPVQKRHEFLKRMSKNLPPFQRDAILPEKRLSGLVLAQEDILYGWFFNEYELFNYRVDQSLVPRSAGITLYPEVEMKAGAYMIRWFDTMTGEYVSSSMLIHPKKGKLKIPAPDITLDLAFKMYRIGEVL